MTKMTTARALERAQAEHPLDLVARSMFLAVKRDTCASRDRTAWDSAYWLTRNGRAVL